MANEPEYSRLVTTLHHETMLHNAKVGDLKNIEVASKAGETEITHRNNKIELKYSYISDPNFTLIASKNGEVVRPEATIKLIQTGGENKWYHTDFSNDVKSGLTTNELSNWLIDKVLSI